MAHRPKSRRAGNKAVNSQRNKTLIALLNNFREPSSLFMKARHRERQSFAYFSSAVARKVRRQQANLATPGYEKA